MANDGSAPFWNPAGTAFMNRAQGSFMWERAYPGLSDADITSGFLSAILPSRFGSVGGALTSYSFGSLLTENVALLNYGRKFGNSLGLGVNFKYFTHDYKIGNNPAFASNAAFANGTVASNATFDAGALYRFNEKVSVGVAGRNLTEPDVGLISTDKVPSEYQGGLAWVHGQWALELDLGYKNSAEGDFKSKTQTFVGGEYLCWKSNRFDLTARSGLNRDFSADQKKAFKNLAAGFSITSNLQGWLTLSLDYAYLLNFNLADSYSMINQAASHKIGLSLLFGPPKNTQEMQKRGTSGQPLYNYTVPREK